MTFKDSRRYWKQQEEEQDRTLCRAYLGKRLWTCRYGKVVTVAAVMIMTTTTMMTEFINWSLQQKHVVFSVTDNRKEQIT
jgi:hypothetical protein